MSKTDLLRYEHDGAEKLQMTGLNPESDSILSLACLITDYDLNVLEPKGHCAVIHHDKEVLEGMGDWCKGTHGHSGLSAQCISSTTSADEAARGLLEYIRTYVKAPRHALLAGNSVHADKSFLCKHPLSPAVKYLHHRILDVSAIKEAAKRWASELTLKDVPQKMGLHEAKSDISESLEEARIYRSAFFRPES